MAAAALACSAVHAWVVAAAVAVAVAVAVEAAAVVRLAALPDTAMAGEGYNSLTVQGALLDAGWDDELSHAHSILPLRFPADGRPWGRPSHHQSHPRRLWRRRCEEDPLMCQPAPRIYRAASRHMDMGMSSGRMLALALALLASVQSLQGEEWPHQAPFRPPPGHLSLATTLRRWPLLTRTPKRDRRTPRCRQVRQD